MAITVLINSVDKTSSVRLGTLNIQDKLNSRNSCKFRLIDTAGTYRPLVGQEVEITDTATEFKGTIEGIKESRVAHNNSTLSFDITCVDYNQLCDRYTVAQVYDNMTLKDIVEDIVDTALSGESVTYTNVETGPTITKAVFNYKTVTQCFNELSNLAGMDWYIDYDKDLHFFSRSSNSAPEDFTNANNNFIDIEIENSREQYRNRQYLRAGNDITDSRTETFLGDGERKTFTLKYLVAKVPTSVLVGVTVKTIGIRDVETGKDFYWSKGSKEITQDDSGTALTDAEVLSITYQGLYPIIIRADKEDGITDRVSIEGGTGVYEAIEEDMSIESQDTAKDKADALLRRYGTIPQRLYITTDSTGFKAGQLVNVNVTEHDLDGTYLIQSVTKNTLGKGDVIRSTITALSGENIGGWVDFFRKIIESGKEYVIRENEVLIRILSFSDDITISDDLTVSSAEPESRCGYAMVGFSEVS